MSSPRLLLLFLQLCSLQLMLVAMPTCRLDGHITEIAHDHLRKVAEPFPVACLPFNANISFPVSAFPAATANQCRRALWVVHESLNKTFDLLVKNLEEPETEDRVHWKEPHRGNFMNLQYQLLGQGSCLSGFDSSGLLSSYFSNVTAVIQQDSAVCGWLALRRDLLWVLQSALQNHRRCFNWRR